jgi:glycosyltransferase involved in cell wall biosynthesis
VVSVHPGRRPLISVVVPVFNVAPYLQQCVDSISSQSVGDLEIVAVDDGSQDDSGAILAAEAGREPRLRIITQDNRGLGDARNAGAAAARGTYLTFADSDDLLTAGALERLLAALEASGSDFATGNVQRLTGTSTAPARFLAMAFERDRFRTHIHRFPALIADRVAWNKLYRRSFWDQHGFTFPTRVHYEDQYVTLPAHYLARAVDVVAAPVYSWRVREDADDASITQQRHDPASMRDRIRAVRYVSDFLRDHDLEADKRRYDESAVTHDLRYFLKLFDDAEPAYRAAFLEAVGPYLESVDPRVFRDLPAIRRLEWEFALRADEARLAELVRFERTSLGDLRATREGRQWYAELPGRDDPALGLPAEAFRVRRELRLVSTVGSVTVAEGRLRIRGQASVELLGPISRRLRLLGIPSGLMLPLAFHTHVSADGSYLAELSVDRIWQLAAGRAGTWRLVMLTADRGLRRIAVWHEADAASHPTAPRGIAVGSVEQLGGRHREVRVGLVGRGKLTVTLSDRPVIATMLRIDLGGTLDLLGELGDQPASGLGLVARRDQRESAVGPVHTDHRDSSPTFVARLALGEIASAGPGTWALRVVRPGGERGVAATSPPATAVLDGRRVSVAEGVDGYLAIEVEALA